MKERFEGFKRRWKTLNDKENLPREMQENLANREMPTEGLLEYLLDSMCMPFHVFLRGRMGRQYLTFTKIAVSSLFFFMCLGLVQFRFKTDLFVSPFTPGGFRLIPEIMLPQSFGQFFENLRLSWTIWMGTFKPFKDQLLMDYRNPAGMTFKITGIYYLFANFRLWFGKILARIGETENIDSSGVSAIFFMPVWRWAYGAAYLFNFKTDIVKQYLEPLLLFALAQYCLGDERPDYFVFPGICLYMGSLLLALQAFVRSWSIRRDADNALRGKYRNQARDQQMELFDMYAFGGGDGTDLGTETRQPKR